MSLDKPVVIEINRNPECLPTGEVLESRWNPIARRIILKGSSPLGAAHEIAHVKLEHDMSGSPLVDMVHERDAWKSALRRIDPSEIRVRDISSCLDTYLANVATAYGKASRHYEMALGMKDEVVAYAKKRKKEAG